MRLSIVGLAALLLLAGCGHQSEGQANAGATSSNPPDTAKDGTHVPQTFTETINGLDAGASRDAVLGQTGRPAFDNKNCSKDVGCTRWFTTLKYCFPNAASCHQKVELFFNEDGRLFDIQSDAYQIRARTFREFEPAWSRQQK